MRYYRFHNGQQSQIAVVVSHGYKRLRLLTVDENKQGVRLFLRQYPAAEAKYLRPIETSPAQARAMSQSLQRLAKDSSPRIRKCLREARTK